MMQDNNKWLVIKLDELYLIMASMGVKKWYGFGDSSSGDKTAGDVVMMIADLYQDEVISLDSQSIVVCGEYEKMFRTLKESKECVHSIDAEKEHSDCISYFGDEDVVVTRMDRSAPGNVMMTMIDSRKWTDFIIRESLNFDSISKDTERPAVSGEEATLYGKNESAIQTAAGPDVLSVFDKVNLKTGDTEERLIIRENGIKQYMTVERPDSPDVAVMRGGISEARRFLKKWV